MDDKGKVSFVSHTIDYYLGYTLEIDGCGFGYRELNLTGRVFIVSRDAIIKGGSYSFLYK